MAFVTREASYGAVTILGFISSLSLKARLNIITISTSQIPFSKALTC